MRRGHLDDCRAFQRSADLPQALEYSGHGVLSKHAREVTAVLLTSHL